MMRKILIAALFLIFAANCNALTFDLNSDGWVNGKDFNQFATGWQSTYDINDLAEFADEWLTGTPPNTAPTASDINVSCYTYIPTTVTLLGSDDDLPNPPGRLKYIITDLPNDVNAYTQDPVSGGQARIRESDLPYKLSTWGDDVIFATSTIGSTSFKYKVYDGNLYSDEKTVSITVSANPQDCLSFDGSGFVTIPDNALLDLSNGRGIGVCLNTRKAYMPILKKHEAGQPGYEMRLIGGHIVADVYSATEKVATIKSYYRYDNGQWCNVVFAYNDVNDVIELYIGYGDFVSGTTWYSKMEIFTDEYAVSVPAGDYTNDCNLVIGNGYKWEIDAIRAYTLTMTDAFRTTTAIQSRETVGNADLVVSIPVVLFMCKYDGVNNTYTQIYDSKASHLIGTFSSGDHVKYIPFYWHWYDSAFFHQVSR